jgi:3-phenylpropionate/cinnamic acid dioxygenase small subunit
MPIDRHDVESFLFREARLMDSHQYDDWLALWTDDALYWVPSNEDDYDPMRHVSIIYDDHVRLEDRIERLKSNTAHSQDPRSKLSRVISNVEIEESTGGDLTVYSTFNLTELRRGQQDTFAGRTIHTLRPENGTFKIVRKKVLLVNNDEVIDNLTFLV